MPYQTPRFHWSLYEDEPLITDSLVGSFYLEWRRVSVGGYDTYVDSWLASLAHLAEELRLKPRAEVEIPEEPIRVGATRRGNAIRLYFNEIVLPAIAFARFEVALRT